MVNSELSSHRAFNASPRNPNEETLSRSEKCDSFEVWFQIKIYDGSTLIATTPDISKQFHIVNSDGGSFRCNTINNLSYICLLLTYEDVKDQSGPSHDTFVLMHSLAHKPAQPVIHPTKTTGSVTGFWNFCYPVRS